MENPTCPVWHSRSHSKRARLIHDMLFFIVFIITVCGASSHIRKINPSPVSNDGSPIVRISDGFLMGRERKSVNGRTYYSFQGIPYAKPPIGNLRFKNPEPNLPWNGTLDATQERSVCTQIYYTNETLGSEDCLFINVYTQQLSSDKLHPVMVWFHPGSYSTDSGNEANYGPGYLMDAGVVLVTLNYRLNVLGFLSTGDSVVPGNMGLKDQVLSLLWVKKNIGKFGGDPESVTIFGESSGGSAIGYHIVSPQSKGLFHRAISMSGSPITSTEIQRNPQDHAFRLGAAVGCEKNDSFALVECLKTVPARVLIENSVKALSPMELKKISPSLFTPVTEEECEEAFITEDLGVLLQEGKFNKVPFLSGFVSNEGKLALQTVDLEQLNANFEVGVAQDLRFASQERQLAVAKKLRMFYFQNNTIDKSQLYKLSLFISDFVMEEGIDRFARAIADKSSQPVYFYRFSFESNIPLIWDNFRYVGPPPIPGAQHGEDLPYLFVISNGTLVGKMTEEQEKVQAYLTTLWTNFAKTGNPTPASKSSLNISWKPFSSQKPVFLDIGSNLTLGLDVDAERLNFWRRYLPLVVRNPKRGQKHQ